MVRGQDLLLEITGAAPGRSWCCGRYRYRPWTRSVSGSVPPWPSSSLRWVTSGSDGSSRATTAAMPTAAASSPRAAAQPETVAAAAPVAEQYFGLYSAGRFALSWTLLAPSAQGSVSKATWVAVHQGCPPQPAGLAYEVKDTTVTSNTAIVTVSLAGAAASVGPSPKHSPTRRAGGTGPRRPQLLQARQHPG
jgi:hypothetical protein